MRQIVYPLTKQIDYTELRYSLRSIEKYLTPPFEVIIVGDTMPDWINNVTQIELADVKGQPNFSVRRKVLAALEYAEEFLFMNDDIYLLQPDDFKVTYYSGDLKTKGESGAKSLLKQLEKEWRYGLYFGHYPAIYKRDFIEIIQRFTNDVPTKSAYLNCTQAQCISIPDCKIMTAKKPEYIREFIKDKPCFSTGVYSIKGALPVLQELFPDKSKFEI